MANTLNGNANPRPLDERTLNRLSHSHSAPPPLRRRPVPAPPPLLIVETAPQVAPLPAHLTPPSVERISYTIKEAAVVTGLCSATIYNMIRAGKLTKRKVGSRTLIPAHELRALVGAG